MNNDDEGKRRVGIQIALRGGAMTECKHHETNYIDTFGHEGAYRLANSLFGRGDPIVADFPTSSVLRKAVKTAIAESGFECGYCAKWEHQ